MVADQDRHMENANFGLRIVNETVHVPGELGLLLVRNNIRNIQEFVAILTDFPSAFPASFHWTPEPARSTP